MNPSGLALVVVACVALAATACRREPDAAPSASAPERGLPAAEAIDPNSVATDLVAVAAGSHRPLYGKDVDRIEVAAFRLERRPVTNAQFLAFVRANPAWRRSFVKRLFADDGYLAHWPGELELRDDQAERPVTHVSWFAARAYAQWLGRRLPTLAEWELAAADFDDAEATLTPRILEWYGRASTVAPDVVGSGFVARSGIEDLHGLVWEWVDDFNSALVSGESRGDPGLERTLFCGSGAVNAANPSDYAAFMRYALRSSLRAPYTVKNLGFRCAENAGDCCSAEEPAAVEALPGASLWQLASRWTDHAGRVRALSEWRGRPTLVAMGFTNCRYACPRLAADARRILDALKPDERARLRGVLVSFDTERDTPERLAAFAQEQGLDTATWTLLRGDAADVRELAAVLGISYQQAPSGDFAHSNVITLVDADGVIVHRQQGLEVEPTGSVIAIRGLLRERP